MAKRKKKLQSTEEIKQSTWVVKPKLNGSHCLRDVQQLQKVRKAWGRQVSSSPALRGTWPPCHQAHARYARMGACVRSCRQCSIPCTRNAQAYCPEDHLASGMVLTRLPRARMRLPWSSAPTCWSSASASWPRCSNSADWFVGGFCGLVWSRFGGTGAPC